MNEMKRPTDLKRRGFLLAGSVGTAGAVAVAVAPQLKNAPAAAVAAPGSDARYVDGARAARYYETTRV